MSSSRAGQPRHVKLVHAGGFAAADPRIVVRGRLGMFVVRHPGQDLRQDLPRLRERRLAARIVRDARSCRSALLWASSKAGLADILRYSASSESCRSMKPAKARALALACRPVGNTAQSSPGGNDQSASTTSTAPDFSSGVNIHSDPPTETPRPANTASRTPSAALTRSLPFTVTETSADP